MRQGERGKTGDHGQAGEAGLQGPRGATGRSRLGTAQLLVYLLILSVIGVGFYNFEQADRDSIQQRDRICEKQIANREAIRQVYRDVAQLGRSLLDNPDTTPERKMVLERRFSDFERDRLAEFPPILPGCEKQLPPKEAG